MRRAFVSLGLPLALVVLGPNAVAGQDASPSAGRVGVGICAPEPRPTEDLLALWFDPSGTPLASPVPETSVASAADLPSGPPADPPVVVGLSAAAQEWVACANAGDYPRYYALLTDDLARRQGPGPNESPADVRAFLATPAAMAAEEELTISPASEARLLGDGRAGALFTVNEFEAESQRLFIAFERRGDRWLLDEIVELPAAAVATPAP